MGKRSGKGSHRSRSPLEVKGPKSHLLGNENSWSERQKTQKTAQSVRLDCAETVKHFPNGDPGIQQPSLPGPQDWWLSASRASL